MRQYYPQIRWGHFLQLVILPYSEDLSLRMRFRKPAFLAFDNLKAYY